MRHRTPTHPAHRGWSQKSGLGHATTIREHFQIRAALESEACVLCCKNKIDLKRIDQILKVSREVIEDGDYESYASLNQTLHMELWLAAGNDKLENMLSELWNGLSRGMKMNEEEYVRKSLKEHEEIIEYIRSGNEVECYLKMHAHIDESCKTFLLQYA